MFRENRLKRKIAAGEAVYGFWLGLGEPALAEMASAAGYDFVIIDNEHGQQTYAQTLDLMRAARAGDATVMVRPSGQHADEIKRLMDLGADDLLNDGYKLIAGMTDATLFRAGVLADVAQFAAAKKARG